MLNHILSIFALLAAVLSQPLDNASTTAPRNNPLTERTPHLTEADLTRIAPTSSTCAGAEFPSECRTASQALPHIVASFAKYNITHGPVQAALVSLMAYESGEFKYNINHWPGVPGQGTRNMQSEEFNEEYARDLGFGADVWASGDAQALMGAVGRDEFSFASSAWFVTTQCDMSFRVEMWGGSQAAWEQYLTQCVGAALDESRLVYWERAMQVFGN